MKIKLLATFFLVFNFCLNAQITRSEVYTTGTKLIFYPNQCGNTIPEAAGKLTFCDTANNLGVVDESLGLNSTQILGMIPNYANNDEAFVTSEGISIKNEDGSYENIPNIAITSVANNQVARKGVILPNNQIIFLSNSFELYIYDRTTKTLSEVQLGAGFPELIAYDGDSNSVRIITTQSTTRFLYTYQVVNGTVDSEAITGLQGFQVNQSNMDYYDGHLYFGNNTGLHKINLSDLEVESFNTSSTTALPFDRVNELTIDDNGFAWLAQSNFDPDGAIVKFDLSNQTYESYTIPFESFPTLNYDIIKLSADGNGQVWAISPSYPGLINLSIDIEGVAESNLVTNADLAAQGVNLPINSPNYTVNFENDKFYFLTNGSSNTAFEDEIGVLQGDEWSVITDNEPGNIAYVSNTDIDYSLPDGEGGIYNFGVSGTSTITYISQNGEFSTYSQQVGSSKPAIDTDNKPVLNITGSPGLAKFDAPLFYSITNGISPAARHLVRHDDEIWWYNDSDGKLRVLKNEEVIEEYDIPSEFSGFSKFNIDDAGNVWFAGIGQIYRFNPLTQNFEEFPFPNNLGEVTNVVAGINGTMWFAFNNALVFYNSADFTTYPAFSSDDSLVGVYNLALDTNGVAYILNGNLKITKLFNAGTAEVMFEDIFIYDFPSGFNSSQSIIPALNDFNFSSVHDISIDETGALWIAGNGSALKIADSTVEKEYTFSDNTDGSPEFGISGIVFVDLNENEEYDSGEELSNIRVTLNLNGTFYNDFTNTNGEYRFPLYEANINYELSLPILNPRLTTDNREILAEVTEIDQNYENNNFQLQQNDSEIIIVSATQRIGLWGFERERFENNFVSSIANTSFLKSFFEVECGYILKNQDSQSDNILPEILAVNLYEILPTGNFVVYDKIRIEPFNNDWSVDAPDGSYSINTISINPQIIDSGNEIEFIFTIPEIAPLSSYVIEIETEIFDGTQNGTVINYGLAYAGSPDFEFADGTPIQEPVIFFPEEERGPGCSGLYGLDSNNPTGGCPDGPGGSGEGPGGGLGGSGGGSGGSYFAPGGLPGSSEGSGSGFYGPGASSSGIASSFDPNDKQVQGGIVGIINDTNINEKWLTYTVRFENEGNFSAKDVVITDLLDPNLDENSVHVVEASHDYSVELKRIGDGSPLLRFNFYDIFLPFDDANNDGYIKFRIKAKEDIVENTLVNNQASIYFDQNPPIITNIVQNRFVTLVLDVDEFNIASELSIFPNPTSEFITIKTHLELDSIMIYDISGREVLQSKDRRIDISSLRSGTYIVKCVTNKGALSTKLIIR